MNTEPTSAFQTIVSETEAKLRNCEMQFKNHLETAAAGGAGGGGGFRQARDRQIFDPRVCQIEELPNTPPLDVLKK